MQHPQAEDYSWRRRHPHFTPNEAGDIGADRSKSPAGDIGCKIQRLGVASEEGLHCLYQSRKQKSGSDRQPYATGRGKAKKADGNIQEDIQDELVVEMPDVPKQLPSVPPRIDRLPWIERSVQNGGAGEREQNRRPHPGGERGRSEHATSLSDRARFTFRERQFLHGTEV